jgi:hypothetical protein
MNMIKSLILAVLVFFSAFAGSANAVTVSVVEGGTVGLNDDIYFAGVATIEITTSDGKKANYPAIMADVFYNDVINNKWYTDYTTTWETSIITRADMLAGTTTLYTTEQYSLAAPFVLDAQLGFATNDALWTASYVEMVRCEIDGCSWLYASRVYDTSSGLTLLDVFNDTVAAGLDQNYNWDFMFVLNEPNMIVFGTAPSTIPVPSAIWLFGSGLIGLVGIARRRKE